MQIPTGGPAPFVAPVNPPAFSFARLVAEVGRAVVPPPPAGGPGAPVGDRNAAAGTVERPAQPGAPVGAPPMDGLAGLVGQVASRLLGRPLGQASQLKLAMDLAGGAGPAAAVKSLVRTPEVAQGLAARALGLVASGKVSQFLKGGFGAKLIKAGDAFKSGGILGALKSLKEAFGKPSVAKLPVPAAPPAAPAAPAGGAPAVPVAGAPGALAPLTTVPALPEYQNCKIDVSDPEKAVVAAATWVREHYQKTFDKYNVGVFNKDGTINKQAERRNGHELSTHVIGVLRANGLDVTRVVRHPDQEVGSPFRYVNDALKLPDGRNIDFYGGGDNTPQFHDLGAEARKVDLPE